MKKIHIFLCALFLCVSCAPTPKDVVKTESPLVIYPDYQNITIPCNIAPLNFMMRDEGVDAIQVEFLGEGKESIYNYRGRKATFDEKSWRAMLDANKDKSIEIKVTARKDGQWLEYAPFNISVNSDPVDSYLTYRLIEPGFEVWDDVDIEERCVENFSTRFIAEGKHLGNRCMNCHTHGGDQGQYSFFHLRGEKGGTILNRNGQLRKVTLKTPEMTNGSVYGDFHPSGRYAVYTNNFIISSFHSSGNNRLEVYDTSGGMCMVDFDSNKIAIFNPDAKEGEVQKDLNPKYLFSFPCFSSDGKSIYFCATQNPCGDTIPTADDMLPFEADLQYSICRVDFDEETFSFGQKIDTIYNAMQQGGSANLLKCSPDGQYLAFSLADKGTFPIWHRKTKLALLDLKTGQSHILAYNGTYHSWSHNSRWLVFASKREDGQYGRAYFAHVDTEEGTPVFTKPFVLPQADPEHDDMNLRSYNIPDLGTMPVPFTHDDVKLLLENKPSEAFVTQHN